jgi:hypothetical protein
MDGIQGNPNYRNFGTLPLKFNYTKKEESD